MASQMMAHHCPMVSRVQRGPQIWVPKCQNKKPHSLGQRMRVFPVWAHRNELMYLSKKWLTRLLIGFTMPIPFWKRTIFVCFQNKRQMRTQSLRPQIQSETEIHFYLWWVYFQSSTHRNRFRYHKNKWSKQKTERQKTPPRLGYLPKYHETF